MRCGLAWLEDPLSTTTQVRSVRHCAAPSTTVHHRPLCTRLAPSPGWGPAVVSFHAALPYDLRLPWMPSACKPPKRRGTARGRSDFHGPWFQPRCWTNRIVHGGLRVAQKGILLSLLLVQIGFSFAVPAAQANARIPRPRLPSSQAGRPAEVSRKGIGTRSICFQCLQCGTQETTPIRLPYLNPPTQRAPNDKILQSSCFQNTAVNHWAGPKSGPQLQHSPNRHD